MSVDNNAYNYLIAVVRLCICISSTSAADFNLNLLKSFEKSSKKAS